MIPPEPFEDVRRARDEARAELARVTEERDAYAAAIANVAALMSEFEQAPHCNRGPKPMHRESVVGAVRAALRKGAPAVGLDSDSVPFVECGAVCHLPTSFKQPPCRKPAGHERGPDTDWKRDYHSNGSLKWPVREQPESAGTSAEVRIAGAARVVASRLRSSMQSSGGLTIAARTGAEAFEHFANLLEGR